MAKIPNSAPQMKRAELEAKLKPWLDQLPIDKWPMVALVIRGYYLNTMGKPGVNDRGEWDDANGFLERKPDGIFAIFNANADPTAQYRKNLGSVHAPQIIYFKIGKHKGRDAFRQASTFMVDRDGVGLVKAGTERAFNWHDDITASQSTSSEGCQTNPKKIFPAVRELGYMLTRKYYPKTETFPCIIIDLGQERALPAPGTKLSDLKKGTAEWYTEAFRVMGYDPGHEKSIEKAAQKVLSGRSRYVAVAEKFGFTNHNFRYENGALVIPFWAFIGAIHYKECTCDFKGVLHNGERIVGTNKKTTIVPIGRGPFATFEASAIDSIKHEGLDKIKDWSIGPILKMAEQYNGTGYLKYHAEENSPYLWAMTSINDDFGKYVADHKFDAKAPTNKTTGLAAILKGLELLKV